MRRTDANHAVHLFAAEMIDVAPVGAGHFCDMALFRSFAEEMGRNRSALAGDKPIELPAKEIAGVNGHDIEESGFALCIPAAHYVVDGIVFHNSITQSSKCCSSSTVARRERSDADAYMRKPACDLACMCPGR